MHTLKGEQGEFAHPIILKEKCLILFILILLTVFSMPADSQFTDLPKNVKFVDLGVTGNGVVQTLSLTSVFPLSNINGWAGFFGSRVSGGEGVISEMFKFHIEGEIEVKKYEFEIFSYFERNITDGNALTAQLGGAIEPGKYEKGSFSVTSNFGYFIENIQPFDNFAIRKFDPTSFRWLISSAIDWKKLNTELTFTPEIGFKNYRVCAEPVVSFDLTTRLELRLSGALTYNSEPLTDKIRYNYMSILRITL